MNPEQLRQINRGLTFMAIHVTIAVLAYWIQTSWGSHFPEKAQMTVGFIAFFAALFGLINGIQVLTGRTLLVAGGILLGLSILAARFQTILAARFLASGWLAFSILMISGAVSVAVYEIGKACNTPGTSIRPFLSHDPGRPEWWWIALSEFWYVPLAIPLPYLSDDWGWFYSFLAVIAIPYLRKLSSSARP